MGLQFFEELECLSLIRVQFFDQFCGDIHHTEDQLAQLGFLGGRYHGLLEQNLADQNIDIGTG